MPRLTVLPHPTLCPEGKTIDANSSASICDTLLENGVCIEHACGQVSACTTCHVIIRQGYAALSPPDDIEDDLLDMAWGLEPTSRLSCQARMPADVDIVVEIPKYSINHAKEDH